jgi:N-acetylmuramoyl-L-alanine amidase
LTLLTPLDRTLNITNNLLPYTEGLATRKMVAVDLVVIHCTELPDLATAREYGEKIHHSETGTGNSGHYYIDRDGSTHQWVPNNCVAHHCLSFNQRSIGIELVNRGRWPDWFRSDNQVMTEPYPSEQIDALVCLLEQLSREMAGLKWITGHEEVDKSRIAASDDSNKTVKRKLDPGPAFPWKEVLQRIDLNQLPMVNQL